VSFPSRSIHPTTLILAKSLFVLKLANDITFSRLDTTRGAHLAKLFRNLFPSSQSSRQTSDLEPRTPSLKHSGISRLLRFGMLLVRTQQNCGMKDTIWLDGFKEEHLTDFIGFGVGI
jgi:hypothetical protein